MSSMDRDGSPDTSLFSVRGKVVVITGGGTGIGAAMALALDTHGARSVYILGRRLTILEETARRAANRSVKPVVADITSKQSLIQARDLISRQEKYIDVFVANSGVTGPNGGLDKLFAEVGEPSASQLQECLESMDMDEFTSTFHVNVTGTFFSAVAFLPLLNAANSIHPAPAPRAQIIVTSSISAFNRSPYVGFAYAASKAASIHMVKQLSTTLAPFKIRCNAIAPGFFVSEMTEGRWGGGKDPAIEGNVSGKEVPLQRTGTDGDVAGMIIFLTSTAGAYVNGCIHLLDGGRVAIGNSTY